MLRLVRKKYHTVHKYTVLRSTLHSVFFSSQNGEVTLSVSDDFRLEFIERGRSGIRQWAGAGGAVGKLKAWLKQRRDEPKEGESVRRVDR